MNFNFPQLLNDAVGGIVFFTYRYIEALYLLIRFPLRAPRYLAYRSMKNPAETISPYVFIIVNLIIGFLSVEIVGPLIFTDLPTIARSLPAQIDRIENSDFNFVPLLLRSLAILISIDLSLRIASVIIRHRKPREFARYSLLFALGLQPLAVIIGISYLMQFELLNTHHEFLIIGSTQGLLLLLALPTVILAVRMLAPGTALLVKTRHAAAGVALLATIFIFALYIEAGALVWRGFASPPTNFNVSELHCEIGKDGTLEVYSLIENKTQRRFVQPSRSFLNAFADDQLVNMDTLETSLGKDVPLLILDNGMSIWLKAARAATGQPPQVQPGQKCTVWLMDGIFVRGEQSDNWQAK
jgi:hypothetical protein